MRYIKLFLASSIKEFEAERLEFERFIRVLDRIYSKHGVRIDLVACEDMSKELSLSSKQDEINEEIPGCQYFYVIIGKEAGKKTVEEFEIALQSKRTSGQPKIFTYFYKLGDKDERSESVQEFIRRIGDDLGHYFSRFMNIDTVKLDFLVEFCSDYFSASELSFTDGHAVVGGERVLPLGNVPIYARNEELAELRDKKDVLNSEFAKLAADYAAHPEQEQVYEELIRVSEERTRILDRFRELESNVFSLYREVSAFRSNGTELTWYEQEASRQVEQGNYAGAIAILQDKQRAKNLEQAELLADMGLEGIKAHIRENELLIKTLKTQKLTTETIANLDHCYDEASRLILKYQLDQALVREYIYFLLNEKQDGKKALQLANMLIDLGDKAEGRTTNADMLSVVRDVYLLHFHDVANGKRYNDMAYEQYSKANPGDFGKWYGLYYVHSRRAALLGFEKNSESQIEEYLQMISLVEDSDSQLDESYLYSPYTSLALGFASAGEYDKAHSYTEKAHALLKSGASCIQIWLKEGVSWISYGHYYETLGLVLSKEGKKEEALDAYIEALKHREEDYARNSYNVSSIAGCNESICGLLLSLRRYEEAIVYCRKAVEYYRAEAERNPLAWEYALTRSLHKLGECEEMLDRYDSAAEAYGEAYCRRKASLGREDVYESEVIRSCRALAGVLTCLDEYDEAEARYREALTMSVQYAGNDSAKMDFVYSSKRQLARNCLNVSHQYEEAEQLLVEAIDAYRAKVSEEGDQPNTALAWCLNDYADLLCRNKQAQKAIAYEEEALAIYESGTIDAGNILEYSSVCHNMAWVYIEAGQYEEAEPLLAKEIGIRDELTEGGREGMASYLASTYKLYADYYSAVNQYENSEAFYKQALRSYKALSEICEDAFASYLAETSLNYAKLLLQIGELARAEELCRAAIDLYSSCEKKAPIVYQEDLTDAYNTFVQIKNDTSA